MKKGENNSKTKRMLNEFYQYNQKEWREWGHLWMLLKQWAIPTQKEEGNSHLFETKVMRFYHVSPSYTPAKDYMYFSPQ